MKPLNKSIQSRTRSMSRRIVNNKLENMRNLRDPSCCGTQHNVQDNNSLSDTDLAIFSEFKKIIADISKSNLRGKFDKTYTMICNNINDKQSEIDKLKEETQTLDEKVMGMESEISALKKEKLNDKKNNGNSHTRRRGTNKFSELNN